MQLCEIGWFEASDLGGTLGPIFNRGLLLCRSLSMQTVFMARGGNKVAFILYPF